MHFAEHGSPNVFFTRLEEFGNRVYVACIDDKASKRLRKHLDNIASEFSQCDDARALSQNFDSLLENGDPELIDRLIFETKDLIFDYEQYETTATMTTDEPTTTETITTEELTTTTTTTTTSTVTSTTTLFTTTSEKKISSSSSSTTTTTTTTTAPTTTTTSTTTTTTTTSTTTRTSTTTTTTTTTTTKTTNSTTTNTTSTPKATSTTTTTTSPSTISTPTKITSTTRKITTKPKGKKNKGKSTTKPSTDSYSGASCDTKLYLKASFSFNQVLRRPQGDTGAISGAKASAALLKVASLIKSVGGKSKNSACSKDAGKVPCDLLNLPTSELPCEMAARVQKLFEYIGSKCNENWVAKYTGVVKQLVTFSSPKNGITCAEAAGPKIQLKSGFNAPNSKFHGRGDCNLKNKLRPFSQNAIEFGLELFEKSLTKEGFEKKMTSKLISRYHTILKVRISAKKFYNNYLYHNNLSIFFSLW